MKTKQRVGVNGACCINGLAEMDRSFPTLAQPSVCKGVIFPEAVLNGCPLCIAAAVRSFAQ